MKEAIIFDFGFTLFYFENASLEKYLNCFREGLEEVLSFLKMHNILASEKAEEKFRVLFTSSRKRYFSLIEKTNREYRTSDLISLVLKKLIDLQLIEISLDSVDQLTAKLANIFHSYEAKAWHPYENTRETLEEIKEKHNIKLAVLSNHPHHEMIYNLMAHYNLLHYFDVVITSAKVGFRKPHQKIFYFTLNQLDLSKKTKSCAICGDEYADIVGGRRVGLETILYERTYKFPVEKEIKGTNYILIKDISEILDHLN
ncbi:MAG: HAD family hydrolase [Promethearchaeia archaeon]